MYGENFMNMKLYKLSDVMSLQIDYIFSSLGYDIIIAVALLKTLRVYYIFKKPSPNKKVLFMMHFFKNSALQ